MRCRFQKSIFQNKENGFCIFVYHTDDGNVPQAARSKYYKGEGTEFTAVGNHLPDTSATDVELQGKWVKSDHGLQLQIEVCEAILPQTEDGIRSYLASGLIKGIGERTAQLIVDRFGVRTFDIFDNYPESLLEIKGITPNKLEKIMISYQGSHAIRDLSAYLSPFKVTTRKIQKIYETFGNESLDTVKNQPFELCQISGFGFLTVDEIAKANQCRLNDPLRIEGCIHYCMELEMQRGHLFQEKELFLRKVHEQLNYGYQQEVVSEADISKEIYRMVNENNLRYENGALYLTRLYGYECMSARLLAEMMTVEYTPNVKIEFLLAEAQRELGIMLSEKQAEAVKKAFQRLITIITGGPGTGKTMVEKVILYIHKKLGGGKMLLTAPTGRASRRMAESTGEAEAPTMHSALGLTNDEDEEGCEEMLEAELIIVDEFSMVDMRLFYEFVSRIKKGTRLIMIGDINQLPSVGPGNVFRELIQSSVIPVTILDIVFRQNENGRIAMNAHRMQENNATLEYGTDFVFVPAKNDAEASELIRKMYQGAIKQMGVEQVQVLTPYRKKGAVSVNALNEMLWNLANPKTEEIHEIRAGVKIYRVGDKIIHNKNKNDINNGDTGYVTDIFMDEDNIEVARLEFSDGRSVDYNADQLDMIEHAYATTVHKSQGSEYPVVIIPWLPMFYNMLRRNILYTAVTRAKEMVIIVGNKQSIYRAIHNTESDKRNTMLGIRLIKEYNRLLEEKKRDDNGDFEQIVINL